MIANDKGLFWSFLLWDKTGDVWLYELYVLYEMWMQGIIDQISHKREVHQP